MGGPGSGRKRERRPAWEAGVAVFEWAKTSGRPKALGWLAAEVGVDTRTLTRWLLGSHDPTARQALAIERLTGVPVASWSIKADEPHASSSTKAR